jgi:hypothetical protein
VTGANGAIAAIASAVYPPYALGFGYSTAVGIMALVFMLAIAGIVTSAMTARQRQPT